MTFLPRLIEQLDAFDMGMGNLKQAEKLSIAIHEAESKGYLVSKREDKYWLELTNHIQQAYKKEK